MSHHRYTQEVTGTGRVSTDDMYVDELNVINELRQIVEDLAAIVGQVRLGDEHYPADNNIGKLATNVKKNNFEAEIAPTSDDDETQGYDKGSLWIYDGIVFICTNATGGAAKWTQVYPKSVQAGIIAHAEGGQAEAVEIAKDIAEISVCATGGDSVKLPAALAGLQIIVINHGAAAADVFPNTDDDINETGANTAKSLGIDASMLCIAYDDVNWECLTLTR